MNTIYLPVEVSKRELCSRAFLACSLASKGNKVYVFEHTLFDRIGWPEAGIYIGKNCFRTEIPHSLKYYKKMKRSNVDVWLLDEEGGIFFSKDKSEWVRALSNRFDLTALNSSDKVLYWGKWQNQAYKSKNIKADEHITGSPNFDIFQKKYSEIFRDYDLGITGGLKDFILINTRFGLGNSDLGHEFVLNVLPFSDSFTELEKIKWIIEENQLMYSMIEMIINLAERNPNVTFVLRSHPDEDISTYNTLLRKFDNIKINCDGTVDSWIRQSRAVIHNGCSTAIQAFIAEKKVITYAPPLFKENLSTPGLPNTIGYLAKNVNEVNNYLLKKNNEGEFNMEWMDTISHLDSIDYITKLIENEKERYGQKSKFFSIPLIERTKDLISNISKQLFNYNIRGQFADLSNLGDIVNLVDTAKILYDKSIKCRKFSDSCYEVSK